MAKFPGWIDAKQAYADAEGRPGFFLSLRVRRWHPGWWWYVLSHLRLRIGR